MSVNGGWKKGLGVSTLTGAAPVVVGGGALKAGQERVPLAGGGIGFETQIGILHLAVDAAFKHDAKEVAQAEVSSLHAPFVVEARLISGDETAAPFSKCAELRALGL